MPQDLAPKPSIDTTGLQVKGQRLATSTGSTASFSAFNTSFTDYVAIDVQGADCYVTFDGTTPSGTAGVQWYSGQSYFLNVLTAQNLKAVAQAGSGTLQGYEFTAIPGDTQLPDTNVIKARPSFASGTSGNFSSLTVTGSALINVLTVTTTATASAFTATSLITAPHYAGSGGTPTFSFAAGAGSGVTASVVGNDSGGLLTVNSGTGATSGNWVTVIFSSAYATAPASVCLTPATQNASYTGGSGSTFFTVSGISTTGFTVAAQLNNTLSSATFKLYYQTI